MLAETKLLRALSGNSLWFFSKCFLNHFHEPGYLVVNLFWALRSLLLSGSRLYSGHHTSWPYALRVPPTSSAQEETLLSWLVLLHWLHRSRKSYRGPKQCIFIQVTPFSNCTGIYSHKDIGMWSSLQSKEVQIHLSNCFPVSTSML